MEMFPMAQDCIIAFLQIPLINTSLVFLNSKMPSFLTDTICSYVTVL